MRLFERAGHRGRHRAWKSLLEIDDTDPFWTDGDASHFAEELAGLGQESSGSLLAQVTFAVKGILRNDAFHDFNAGRTTNEQYPGWKRVRVDCDRDVRIVRQKA